MKPQIHLSLILALIAMIVAACTPQAQAAEGPTPAFPTSESGGVEDLAGLMETLSAAGAEVELGDPVEQAFFSVIGQIMKVNGQDVQVFEYGSAEEMESQANQVSADGGSVGTSMVTWVATPHFFKSGRILVLYVGDDAATLELLSNTLGTQFAGR